MELFWGKGKQKEKFNKAQRYLFEMVPRGIHLKTQRCENLTLQSQIDIT